MRERTVDEAIVPHVSTHPMGALPACGCLEGGGVLLGSVLSQANPSPRVAGWPSASETFSQQTFVSTSHWVQPHTTCKAVHTDAVQPSTHGSVVLDNGADSLKGNETKR
jgi:hypothetical protein